MLILHVCKQYHNINIITRIINTNSHIYHIEIYPLNFAPVAYLRALCCAALYLKFRFWYGGKLVDPGV